MLYIELMGGLGNQMFIYAFARAYQLRGGGRVVFIAGEKSGGHDAFLLDQLSIEKDGITVLPAMEAKWPQPGLSYSAFRLFRKLLFACAKHSPAKEYALERRLQPLMNLFGAYFAMGSEYMPVKKPAFGAPLVAQGYFQSEAYFQPYAEILRKELLVSVPLTAENQKLCEEIRQRNSVCVHIRRGDYALSQHAALKVCTPAYYQRSVKRLHERMEDAHFYVFSDDIGWVREHVPLPYDHTYIGNPSQLQDFQLMYACKHFIISNSSFSWWAQYLSGHKGKVVIAPNRWYNDARKVDIWQAGWILDDPAGEGEEGL